MKPFFASTGQLWKEQKLTEKPVKFVVSTGTQEIKEPHKKLITNVQSSSSSSYQL
ncbi:hypothetical protein AHAS_Ahas05G0125200 [Arachis hypogaea]